MTDKREHTHPHDHEHENAMSPDSPQSQPGGEKLDAAGQSLSDALRISFAILKVIMIVLVVGFLASGFRTVGPDERALVLQFGRIRGVGDKAIIGPGAHWVFPYPIQELVRIPVEKNINLAINTFWYKETREDILGAGPKPRRFVPETLDPLTEGYCVTGSQRSTLPAASGADSGQQPGLDAEGSDYNIVHTKWQINYQITGVEQFFRNVYIDDVMPGQIYFDVMTASIKPLLESVVENAVVNALVRYSIDEALLSTDTIRRHASRLVQEKLDELESGIRVTQIQLVDVQWPKQVDDAFQAFFTASQTSQQAISEARTYAQNTLTKTASRIAVPLYQALQDENVTEEQMEAFWAQVAGDAQDTIAQAQTYRTKVVEGAKANATYLQSILPEYRKRPEIVLQGIYLDAIQEVLENADEKFILDKSDSAKEQELWVMVNRDAVLKPKQNQQKTGTD
jgi:membrane protease subunit HflK